MPTYGGKDSRGKIITVKPYEEEGEDTLLWLTERHRGLLLAMTEYLDWASRWAETPPPLDDKDTRDAYVSNLKLRLMEVVEFCAEVIGCIDNDENVRATLRNFINSITGDFGGSSGYGTGMSDEELTQNLAGESNPTCDLDILYAQCLFVIEETHRAVIDVLQKVEIYSNSIEVVNAVWDSIPLISLVDDATGAEGILALANYWLEAVQEQYEAQYTETVGGLRDYLSYQLFCRCKSDCVVTIDRILWVYENELKKYIAPPSLSGLIDLLEVLAGLSQDETFVVELAHYAAWGLVKLVKYFFGRPYERIIEIIIQLKANEPDDNWEALEILFGACAYLVYVRADAEVLADNSLNGNDTGFDLIALGEYALNPDGVWQGGTSIDYDARGNLGVTNPSAIVPTANIYRLVYKIGIEGTWLATDDTFVINAATSGRLFLAINDVPGAYSDNIGQIECTIIEV